MKVKQTLYLILSFIVCICAPVNAQSLEEKIQSLEVQKTENPSMQEEKIQTFISQMQKLRREIKTLYQASKESLLDEEHEKTYADILQKKQKLKEMQVQWQELYAHGIHEKNYLEVDTGKISLTDLIIEYAPPQYIYLIPSELDEVFVEMSTQLLIPSSSAEEFLDHILISQGISYKQTHPFIRELKLSQEQEGLQRIIASKTELDLLASGEYVAMLYTLESAHDIQMELLQELTLGMDLKYYHWDQQILFVGSALQMKQCIDTIELIQKQERKKAFRIVHLKRSQAQEMKSILQKILSQKEEDTEHGVHLLPLNIDSHALLLIGSSGAIQECEAMINQLEEELKGSQEKTVFWYHCKNSSSEELAQTLNKVYPLLLKDSKKGRLDAGNTLQSPFISDVKTGSLLVIVPHFIMPTIQEMLAKLDVPKQMVCIETLLVEKKVKNSNHIGMSQMNMGASATGQTSNALSWLGIGSSGSSGVLSFLTSQVKRGRIPAYDLAYRFLLTQENIQINASPSVTTVNQTPASIEIVEEISINTGTIVERDSNKNSLLKDAFTRSEYGIVIEVTPNIHPKEEGSEEAEHYITLQTDIRFDSTNPSSDDRPDVTKRHIKNEVRIANGETVIIGGLRRKDSSESSKKIPFLGELPGLGKLFSASSSNENDTEMFIFLTPRIIENPKTDFAKLQEEQLRKRPHDLPEFLDALLEARQKEKKRLMQESLEMIFGSHDHPSYYQRKRAGS